MDAISSVKDTNKNLDNDIIEATNYLQLQTTLPLYQVNVRRNEMTVLSIFPP